MPLLCLQETHSHCMVAFGKYSSVPNNWGGVEIMEGWKIFRELIVGVGIKIGGWKIGGVENSKHKLVE